MQTNCKKRCKKECPSEVWRWVTLDCCENQTIVGSIRRIIASFFGHKMHWRLKVSKRLASAGESQSFVLLWFIFIHFTSNSLIYCCLQSVGMTSPIKKDHSTFFSKGIWVNGKCFSSACLDDKRAFQNVRHLAKKISLSAVTTWCLEDFIANAI